MYSKNDILMLIPLYSMQVLTDAILIHVGWFQFYLRKPKMAAILFFSANIIMLFYEFLMLYPYQKCIRFLIYNCTGR